MNYEFDRVFRKANTTILNISHSMFGPRNDDRIMLGITVSRQVKGKCQTENQVKRWLREVYRANEHVICTGYDLGFSR